MASTQTKNQTWIWYLAIIAGLTVASITTLVVFNVRQQLTLERLDAAEALWKQKRPASYDMVFTKHIGERGEKFHVEVRNGTVVSVKLDGRPLEERQHIYYSMETLFDYVRRFLEIDSEPGKRRPYVIATFEPADGHLVRYIRSDGVTGQRVELHVQELKTAP